MKKILVLLALASTFLSKAQPDDFLFLHPWYLYQANINGQTQIPNNSELFNVVLTFNETTPYTLDLEACRTLSGVIEYPSSFTMFFPNPLSESGAPCVETENLDFENAVFNFFQNLVGTEFSYDFTIVDFDPPTYFLFIEDGEGNYVEFTEVPRTILGVNEYDNKLFSIFPNPVTDKVQVRSLSSQNISTIRVFSLQGSVLVETENDFINVQHLTKGMYLLEMTSEDGFKQIEKILKK